VIHLYLLQRLDWPLTEQGLSGSKTAYTSISYKSISRFSVETGWNFELDAEFGFQVNYSQSIKKAVQ
jgi:hypothetical protein